MDVSKLLDSLQTSLGTTLPAVVGAVAILILGWIVAVVVRAGIRKALDLTGLDRHILSRTGQRIDVQSWIATGVYYLILLVVMIGFFNALQLERVSTSLQSLVDQVFAYAPRIVAGGVLLLVAFGLTLGSVAVAVALSFGLGGREAAGRQMEHWLSRLRGEAPARRAQVAVQLAMHDFADLAKRAIREGRAEIET